MQTNILAVITVDFIHHGVGADQIMPPQAVVKNGRYLVTDDGQVHLKTNVMPILIECLLYVPSSSYIYIQNSVFHG